MDPVDFSSQEIVDETDVYALGLSFRKLLGTDGIPMGKLCYYHRAQDHHEEVVKIIPKW